MGNQHESCPKAVGRYAGTECESDESVCSAHGEIVENTIPDGYFDATAPILVIMGPAGSGKTVVASAIAKERGWDLAEADDFHPQSNIDKMAAGIPLTDEDRWGWLDTIGQWIGEHTEQERPGVVTCSALKRIYRDRLRMPGVVFIYLKGDYDTVMALLAHRHGHFMKPEMLDSQFAILEPPSADEVHLTIDLGAHPTVEDEVHGILGSLRLRRTASGPTKDGSDN